MKHEKAILIFLAYVIGFITAFIAFALNESTQDSKSYKAEKYMSKNSGEATAMSYNIEAVVKEDGLFMIKDGKERILSAHMAMAQAEDGFHESIVAKMISSNGNFIYYCAMLMASDEECVGYVYSVDDDVIYKMMHEGDTVTLSMSEASSAYWTDNILTIGEMSSVQASTPWQMQ